MQFRDRAVALARRRNLRLFKLGVGAKFSVTEEFYNLASSDPKRVYDMWTCPVMGESLHNNIGVATGNGLLVLDIDVKGGKPGMQTLYALIAKRQISLADRYVVATPSGGLHVYFRIPEHMVIPNRVDAWPGIDIRGHHGYVVGEGSELGDRVYGEYRDGR